jgi:DNA-binding NarL/FixJ family response regulator
MEPQSRARLLIADDHELVAEACKNLLEPEFDVVGIVNDGRALLRSALELKPDVAVVDIAMPLLNGLDAGEQLKQLLPSTKIVYLTMNTDAAIAADAFRRGASAYLPKTAAASELITAIREVLEDRSYLSPLITKDIINFLISHKQSGGGQPELTQRQKEVLQLLAQGLSMKETAFMLNVKPGTVAFHKYRIMSSLGLKNTAELLQYAIKQHMIA